MRLLVVVFIISIASLAVKAHADRVGIFTDVGAWNCGFYNSGGSVQLYVVHLSNTSSSQVRFAAPLPPCLSGSVILSVTSPHTYTGDFESGITVDYGSCNTDSDIHVLTIQLWTNGSSQSCCYYLLQPHPDATTNKIEIEDCGGNTVPVGVWAAIFNPAVNCYCSYLMIEPEVTNPFPQDGATGAATDVQLSWDTYDPENGVSEYSIWFGPTQDPPSLQGRFVGEVFDPDTLVQGTTYYWSVGVWWEEGTLARGPVWSFTTTGSSPVKSSTWGAIKALYKKE